MGCLEVILKGGDENVNFSRDERMQRMLWIRAVMRLLGKCAEISVPLAAPCELLALRWSIAREICDAPGMLTKICSVGKVLQGRANGPFLLPAALRWEVVQLAVHQILDLIILVRVQASQPIFWFKSLSLVRPESM